ncbi:MAG TPA: slipin family protein [Gemmata sp.]|jgi:regulator of protease activity HflC (stomatin/prohibitin superfamily)|nr:slipin family protein [Gemmata sp.]
MSENAIFIKDTHRGLWYEDGVLTKVLTAGRYEVPKPDSFEGFRELFGLKRKPQVEVVFVDMRARDLTIKGQEILTADKVAIRVSILVQFAVVDPKAAVHAVANYEDRLYSDVQLAARRSLASMSLEDILTNRTRLSEDILKEVKELAIGYGVAIARADVKDLVFPGNLQEIMNRVLAAERMSQAQLVESRTKAEVQKIEALAKADTQRLQAQTEAEIALINAKSSAESAVLAVQAEMQGLEERQKSAGAYGTHPALLRLEELKTLRELARNANARLYLDFQEKQGAEAAG